MERKEEPHAWHVWHWHLGTGGCRNSHPHQGWEAFDTCCSSDRPQSFRWTSKKNPHHPVMTRSHNLPFHITLLIQRIPTTDLNLEYWTNPHGRMTAGWNLFSHTGQRSTHRSLRFPSSPLGTLAYCRHVYDSLKTIAPLSGFPQCSALFTSV